MTATEGAWRKDAACAVAPALFWPVELDGAYPFTHHMATAIHICRRHCPVRAQCLTWVCREVAEHRQFPAVVGGFRWVTDSTNGTGGNGHARKRSDQKPCSVGCPLCGGS